MRRHAALLFLSAVPFIGLAQTVVNFDNLADNADENVGLPAKYMGLTWSSQWGWTDGLLSCFGPCGFINGTVSAPNVAYNALGDDVSVSSTTPFLFESAYLTAAWNDGMHVDIYGYLAGMQTNSMRVLLNTTGPQEFTFDWNVDTITFHSEADGLNAGYNGSGGQIVFDNIAISSPLPCEINNNGAVNVADVQLLINQAAGRAQPANDLNGDGAVNVVDVQIEIDAALNLGCSASGPLSAFGSMSTRFYAAAAATGAKIPAGGERYRITELGTLGGSSAMAYGLNNLGQVVGTSAIAQAPVNHAFLWEAGRMIDLNIPAGDIAIGGIAYGIDDGAHVTGVYSYAGNHQVTFLYVGGSAAVLSTAPFGGRSAINNAGQVVGVTLSDLGTLGGDGSTAYAINDSGEIAGSAYLAGNSAGHAFLYSGAGLTDLGTLGGMSSVAFGINRTGQAVGSSQTGDGSRHAFLYRGGPMMDLGTLGGTDSQADGINSRGLIVGWANTASGERHAFLWGFGRMLDLNSLVAVSPDVALVEATAVNDMGQVVANGSNGRAYLITLPGQWQ